MAGQADLMQFDRDLIRRYDGHGPRYTSYPTAVQFHSGFDATAYRESVEALNADPQARAISLYVHIPFCASPCFYCGCNKIITRSADRAEGYLLRLHREIELQAALFGAQRSTEQLHFGGGTPTFLSMSALSALMSHLDRHFPFASPEAREFSIEIDPRTVTREAVRELRNLGFNRMSLGIQDFDPIVQRAVNRIQSREETLQVIEGARQGGFDSVSVDLIYGLPKQTIAGFGQTLKSVLEARPDRLAVYAYAHMPHVFKAQRRLRTEDLPSAEARLELLALTVETLTRAGYVYVGMDHFALPEDSLVRAKRERSLHRNFQGYSTRADCDLVGLGVSAIGKVRDSYAQNAKTLPDYYAALDSGRLPIQRGVRLTPDDVIRRAVIQELMCHERIDFSALDSRLGIDFERYFRAELQRLEVFVADGLIALDSNAIRVSERGRLLLRNIAMVFDGYLTSSGAQPVFSRAI
jgi:oxygen-independent coproporphyrinogen III oxidase